MSTISVYFLQDEQISNPFDLISDMKLKIKPTDLSLD